MPNFMGMVVREDCHMKNWRVYPAQAGVLKIVFSLSDRLTVSSDLLSKIGGTASPLFVVIPK